MNKKDNLKFQKSVYSNHNSDLPNPRNQRDKLKLKIMSKYNLSPEEANRLLIKIEENERIKRDKKIISNNESSNNFDEKQLSGQNANNKNVNDSKIRDSGNVSVNEDLKKKKILSNVNDSKIRDSGNVSVNEDLKKKKIQNINNINESNENQVDNILEKIIPDYNQQISIDLNHVDLTFEVQNEKIDTLKEAFIRTLNRNKSKKIRIHALKDVSFKIFKGEKVGIIGYNGAGKSTLLNVISGIYPTDNGTVVTNGKISPLLSLGAGFDYNFSGRQNIILNGAVLGYDKDFLESKMDEIIEFSELGKYIDIPIKNYSSGMLAKLGFSIATSVNPDILIIDEILAVGDVNFQKKSADKIRSLMDAGTTVLLVSHSIPQIREICDKAIWLDNGELKEMGDVNSVCDHYLKDAEKASNEQLANIKLTN